MKNRNLARASFLLTAAVLAGNSQAEMYWSNNSLSLLHGADYLHPFTGKDMEMTTMTVEHASGHNWGDAFFFMDRHNGKGQFADFQETYSELSPRFSLSSMSGKSLSAGPLQDVLLAFTYENGSNSTGFSQDNYLYGFGLKWKAPGFAFLNTNFYYADNENVQDDLQLTVTYGVPFALGTVDMMFDGYLDWSTAESDHASDFHFNPQLKANVGKFMGITKSKLELGIEYSFWSNKFGVATDDNESAVSALIKYTL